MRCGQDEGWEAGHCPPHCCPGKYEGPRAALALTLNLALDSLFRQSLLSRTRGVVCLSRSLCSICLQKGLVA